MDIKALVFDFGNVVAFFDHRLTSKRLAAHTSVPVDAIHAYLFNSPLEEAFDSGRISTADFLKQVRQALDLRCTENELASAWADIFWPNPDVIELLPRVKPGFRLLLASNTNELHTRQFCRQFADALGLFDSRVFSHDVGVCKPKPTFFEHCRRLAGCHPQQCLFIDDLPANVAGAQACGWHGIVYQGIEDLRKQLASFGITA
jgi:putative hydrolase of the HAD superfamily